MKITLTDVGKRFNHDWIFRHIHYEFELSYSYAVIGPNGSGKSTLLQVIAGATAASEGKVSTRLPKAIHPQPITENFYQEISLAAPYLELIEEMTLTEFLYFHQTFKPFITGLQIPAIISEIGLAPSADKQIRYFSSGMKQRVKLAQAIFSATPALLLDEPCTNLDEAGVGLYRQLIASYAQGRIVIVSSNDRQEYDFCTQSLNMLDYKP